MNIPIIADSTGDSPTSIMCSTLGRTGRRGCSCLLVSATKELRGGIGLVGRLRGVGQVVTERVPNNTARALLILSTAANRGTLVRTGRFGRAASIANLVLAGLSKATGNKIVLTVHRRVSVPIGFIKLNRNLSSLRPFSPRRCVCKLMGSLLRGGWKGESSYLMERIS